METASTAEVFLHVRVLLGTIIGLGITRLIMNLAGTIQHPKRKVSLLHLLWVISMIIELVLFWWWQFSLTRVEGWTFAVTAFIIAYAMLLLLIASLLTPDNIAEYSGHEDFFLKRRFWFFGFFALVGVFDQIDNALKSGAYAQRFGDSYNVQTAIGLMVCIIACATSNRKVHLVIVLMHFAYQLHLMRSFYTG
jgi:hypothetical protein